jgi:hypothetical protein
LTPKASSAGSGTTGRSRHSMTKSAGNSKLANGSMRHEASACRRPRPAGACSVHRSSQC